jgi:hypothetical protein
MSVLNKQPLNNNFLSPLGLRFTIKKAPLVSYFVQSANIPSISINRLEIPNPFIKFPLPGTELTFNPLVVQFKVDEDLKNYLEIYNWLIAIGFPDDFNQYRQIANADPMSGEGIFSDCTLTVLSSAMNPNIEITYIDAYPTTISDITFDSREQDVNYIEATATFAYRRFKINNF